MSAKITLGFSPSPSDTFMFHALVNKLIDLDGLDFQVHMADVEQLDKLASEGTLDVTKVSISAFAHVGADYVLLDAGNALGYSSGPILVSKKKAYPDEIEYLSIAIPGEKSAANLLMNLIYPKAKNKQVYLYSEIEDVVLSGETDAGLIIHESRFTYKKKGLQKVVDLGIQWQRETTFPVPIGYIAARRQLDVELLHRINEMIAKSVAFALENKQAGYDYIRSHAKELDDKTMQQHIDLYVNNFSVDLNKKGRKAIAYLLKSGQEAGLLPKIEKEIFVKNNPI